MEGLLLYPCEDDGLRCRKHPYAQPATGGVCPVCLRARLLRLCPDCAGERPSGCVCPSTSSTASSSSLSSVSSLDRLPRSATAGTGVGAVGRISHLIDSEPAFRRSRSTVLRLLRPPADGTPGCGLDAPPPHFAEVKGRSWLWTLARGKKPEPEPEFSKHAVAAAAVTRLSRSRSVGVAPGAYPDAGAPGAGRGAGVIGGKGWNRYFPSPMKAFRQRKASKVIEARSPLCRG